jgi:aspartyl-tRNA(Asn)/glutamyl-tRNA(Gln) amidotransferase subunit C
MDLSREQVQWVAHLARLELSDQELDVMTRQLRNILEYVNQLQQVPTEGVEPMAHPLPIANVFRPDDSELSLSVDQALANAPARQGDYYRVPAVLE